MPVTCSWEALFRYPPGVLPASSQVKLVIITGEVCMKPPLLLIGHGSGDDNGAAEFGRFVHRLRCRLDQKSADVSGGYLEKARPLLSDSVASLVARGHHHLVALSLTLDGEQDGGKVP